MNTLKEKIINIIENGRVVDWRNAPVGHLADQIISLIAEKEPSVQSPAAMAGSATKSCDHIVAIIYSDHEGGEIRTAKELEKSSYDDIEKFKYCSRCGEAL